MRNLMFNNIELSELIDITKVKESVIPSLTVNRMKLNNQRGTKFIRQTMGERIIEVEANLYADSIEERREVIDKLALILYTEKPVPLVIDEERTFLAIFEGDSIISNIAWDGVINLQFVAPDPIAYGREIRISEMNNDSFYFNSGTADADCIITIKPDGDMVDVRPLEGMKYEYIRVSGLLPDDMVDIDLKTGRVLVNSRPAMNRVDALGESFSIKPGEFRIIVSGGKASLKLTERWL